MEILDVSVQSLQFVQDCIQKDWKDFLQAFLGLEINNKGGLVCRIITLVLDQISENVFLEQWLLSKFDGDVADMVDMVNMLEAMSAQDPQIELSVEILQCLEMNYDQLLDSMSPRTIEYCALRGVDVCNTVTLEFYSYYHSKYKQQVSPKLWKAVLISAKELQRWEAGYKTLNHIPEDRRKKEVDWKLDTEQLKQAEILLVLYGNGDLDQTWVLIEGYAKQLGNIPQHPIQKLLEKVIEEANPYQCSIFVQKVTLLMKQTGMKKADLQLLVTLSELVVLCDQSVEKTQVVTYLLLIYFMNAYKLIDLEEKKLTKQFIFECSLCGPDLLPVLVYISLDTIACVSDELLILLEEDEKAQKWLQQTYNSEEIVDLILYTPQEELLNTPELTKHHGTKRCKERVVSYLTSLQGKPSYSNGEDIGKFDEQEQENQEGYDGSRWLIVLTQDPKWKSWPLEKMQSCAQKLSGSWKLKKHRQQKDLISFIEKTRDQILA